MKKLILTILMFFSTLVFADKTYNETKFRQDVLNYALSNIGKPYSQAKRMNDGYFDCSSFVNRAIVASNIKGGVDGKNGSYGTTATMRSTGDIKKVDFNKLKPGDFVNFKPQGIKNQGHVGIVIENLGNGRIKMAHASSVNKKTIIDEISLTSGNLGRRYIGVISATDVLKNNGYTAVNQNGEIIVPEGIPVSQDEINRIEANYNNKYNVDFDSIKNTFLNLLNLTVNAGELFSNFGKVLFIFLFLIINSLYLLTVIISFLLLYFDPQI